MAEVKLLPRKVFEITLESGEVIRGKHGIYQAKRFCDKKKLSLSQFIGLQSSETLSMDDLCELLLCAVESVHRETGEKFKYNDFDVCNWVEELGGFGSEKWEAVMNHAATELPEEKKSEV